MELTEAIGTRSSATRLGEPGPTAAQLDAILRAGTRAPDHGRLSPWRFLVLEGDARGILGEAMAAAEREKDSAASASKLDGVRAKATRAPTIVVVSAAVQPHPKVPEVEQVLAVGAAVENMLLSTHAMGLGAMWKTGGAAYSPTVKRALGLAPSEHIVAFLYLGTAIGRGPVRPAAAELPVRRL